MVPAWVKIILEAPPHYDNIQSQILSREVSDVEPRGVLQQRMSCLLLSSRARGCQAPLGSHPQVLSPHFIVVVVVVVHVYIYVVYVVVISVVVVIVIVAFVVVLIVVAVVVIVFIIVVVILNVVVIVAGSRKYPGQIEGVPVVRGAAI